MFKNILVAVDLEDDTHIDDLLSVASGIANFLAPLNGMWRAVMAISGLLMVAPGWGSDLTALVVAAPVIFMQVTAHRLEATSGSASVDGD